MKQTIFTTRQRAEEIIKEAVAVWAQSSNSEHLEGLERDPVFSLFLTALAYQANEIDDEIEQLKTEIINEFAQTLIPYERVHALPATAVVEVVPEEGIPLQILDHRVRFSLLGTPYTFIPLLRTKVFQTEVSSVVRLDNRRWKVVLYFKEAVDNLSGLTFLVDNPDFQDLKVFANGHPLPLVKPWDYADLPLDDCFSPKNMLYNQSPLFQSSHTWFDLFAKQNVRLFCIDNYKTPATQSYATDKVELVFEFSGIPDSFLFDKERLSLNCTLLTNASVRTATLSTASPVVRLSGEEGDAGRWQFLHLVRPPVTQLFRDEPIEIRNVAADRFNPDRLVKLAGTLISRFASDYYAFQDIDTLREGAFMDQFYALLKKMSEGVAKASEKSASGLYLMLRNNDGFHPKEVSLNIDYLVTNGTERKEPVCRSGRVTREVCPTGCGSDARIRRAATDRCTGESGPILYGYQRSGSDSSRYEGAVLQRAGRALRYNGRHDREDQGQEHTAHRTLPLWIRNAGVYYVEGQSLHSTQFSGEDSGDRVDSSEDDRGEEYERLSGSGQHRDSLTESEETRRGFKRVEFVIFVTDKQVIDGRLLFGYCI